MLKGKMLTGYFARKYLPAIRNLTPKPVEPIIDGPVETIWQFWDNPVGRTTPEIVKSCIESVKRFKGNFEHKVLNNSTIGGYSDLPGYVMDKFKSNRIDYAHFSDLLRLNLLKNHGGIWLDATAYMTDFIPKYIVDEIFFVFLTGRLTRFPYSFMQNCFIRSLQGNVLCEAWYWMCVEYWKNETKTIDYFQHQLMFKALVFKNQTARGLFEKMPRRTDDEVHRFIGDNLFSKFDAAEWERIKKTSFFQKTTFKVPAGAAERPNTYFSKLCGGV
ncbi:MAG: capsular polysaccharide synthesis protein [Bacteroidales bacterium]|jgi:hypothetical protein|nr:capsular polysaccharide synthesis protein [Bacteroidales bacterium]